MKRDIFGPTRRLDEPARRLFLTGLAATFGGLAMRTSDGEAAPPPPAGARTILFDTTAFYEPAAESWIVPLHAWVSTPAESAARKAAIAALFKSRYGLVVTDTNRQAFDERINLLLADNTSKVTPRVFVDDLAYRLPATAANGHTRFEAVLKGSPGDSLLPFKLTVQGPSAAASPTGAPQPAYALRLGPEGFSVISDIDDTVKDTGVLDRRRLWESTFFKPFASVAGMAALLTRLAGPERAVHFVSSSPWHLYAPLRQFLITEGFPCAALHLKHIRLKDSSILDILKSPEKTKPPLITAILARYPRRRFSLVGDSGEKDPEVYGDIARTRGAQIARILIRRAPGDTSAMARFETAFAGLPRTLWQVFDDPTEVV